MPGIPQLALLLAILLLLAGAALWLYRRGKDRQALREHMAALEASEAARSREQEIRDAVDTVRRDPGPKIPDL